MSDHVAGLAMCVAHSGPAQHPARRRAAEGRDRAVRAVLQACLGEHEAESLHPAIRIALAAT